MALEVKKFRAPFVALGCASDEVVARAVAERCGVPFIRSVRTVPSEVLGLIPEVVARSARAIAFAHTDAGVKVAMVRPGDLETYRRIVKRIGAPILPHAMTPRAFAEAVAQYHPSAYAEVQELLRMVRDVARPREERGIAVGRLLDALLRWGHENDASDIILTTRRDRVGVWFRIDGAREDVAWLPKDLHTALLARVRALAQIRADARRIAQHGSFAVARGKSGDGVVRVSVMPIMHGEDVVMRMSASSARKHSLQTIGMAEQHLTRVRRAVAHPCGMVLITGPLGSGRTTTLYALLNVLKRSTARVATVEESMEYDVDGVHQMEVGSQSRAAFAAGLRAALERSSDIIVASDLHNAEAVGIAMDAALAGRLVLSALCTDSAPEAFVHLADMGVEPFLLAAAMRTVIAQRLVRRICTGCRVPHAFGADEQRALTLQPAAIAALAARGCEHPLQAQMFVGKGCAACGYTGYAGRTGLFEVLEVTDALRERIAQRAPSHALRDAARADGMTTMLEDGIAKALQGITTMAEVLRVVKV